jgi:hypothetical protein
MNMDDLLNALNQGAAAPGAGDQPDMGSLLGGLLGGAGASPGAGGDPLSGLLGGLLGGQGSSGFTTAGSGSPLDALIQPLAQKLGISPEIASTVVTFLMNALISGKMAGRSETATTTGIDLGDAIAGFGGSKAPRASAANSRLAQELSQETGLDQKTAAASIDEFVNLLGGPAGIDRLRGGR